MEVNAGVTVDVTGLRALTALPSLRGVAVDAFGQDLGCAGVTADGWHAVVNAGVTVDVTDLRALTTLPSVRGVAADAFGLGLTGSEARVTVMFKCGKPVGVEEWLRLGNCVWVGECLQ